MFEREIASLAVWLESWNRDGSYCGPVIHRCNSARLLRVHETEWTQSAVIEGYLNLYERHHEPAHLERAVAVARNDLRKYGWRRHVWRYAGHEDDHYRSLVHCALIDNALLRLYKHVDDPFREQILSTVRDNVDGYLVDRLWNEERGAFAFSAYGPSRATQRFVVNMNAEAVKTLAMLQTIEGSRDFSPFIERALEFVMASRISSDDPLLNHALPYERTDQATTNCVAIYEGLTLSALSDVCRMRPSARLREFIAGVASHLAAFRDPDSGLFYHTHDGALVPCPFFVAGSAFCLRGLRKAEAARGIDLSVSATTREIVERYRLPHGAYPGFVAYDSPGNGRTRGTNRYGFSGNEVFEDVTPTLSWNAHMFEHLTSYSDNLLPDAGRSKYRFSNGRCVVRESDRWLCVLSWWPWRSLACLLYRKGLRYAVVGLAYYGLKNAILKDLLRR